jgi:adenine phosphoribosyltransferase
MSTQDHPTSAIESVATNPSQAETHSTVNDTNASRREPTASSAGAAQLSGQQIGADIEKTKKEVLGALAYHPGFPKPGINFIDILPIFRNPSIFQSLLDVLAHEIAKSFPAGKPDVIVGLEARGFLFGPSLALRIGASFVPVRKAGKMPGHCLTATYEKEYGADAFQVQADGIQPGQKVLIVDDIIATGGSAYAAASLIDQCKGDLLGFLFMIEIGKLNGIQGLRNKLDKELGKFGDKPVVALVDAD